MDSTAKIIDDNFSFSREMPRQRRANLAHKPRSSTPLDLCLDLPILTDIVDDPRHLCPSTQG